MNDALPKIMLASVCLLCAALGTAGGDGGTAVSVGVEDRRLAPVWFCEVKYKIMYATVTTIHLFFFLVD